MAEYLWMTTHWKTEVHTDSLSEVILPPGSVEDKEDTYEAIALAGRVSVVVDEEPSLFDEEDPLSPPKVAQASDAGTPEEDTA